MGFKNYEYFVKADTGVILGVITEQNMIKMKENHSQIYGLIKPVIDGKNIEKAGQ